ncbi:MAG: hypothetical protein AUI50_08720 [Crenarchaeota archaeon 13_1_40CM_2_52_14]|nr:MAG: hypothetical protein AUI97_06520 [Crenarchaeota archaeon 13_1_40CM_3_52_17]OLD33910.1 MAG: hypothetical protein AUI50_08720 [Crenarchaeota archaeon 13_1_40CM_2_52_14]
MRRLTSRIMAGAYLKAPCPGRGSEALCSGMRVADQSARQSAHFTKGAAREKSTPPGGHIIVSEKEIVMRKREIYKKNSYRRDAFFDS